MAIYPVHIFGFRPAFIQSGTFEYGKLKNCVQLNCSLRLLYQLLYTPIYIFMRNWPCATHRTTDPQASSWPQFESVGVLTFARQSSLRDSADGWAESKQAEFQATTTTRTIWNFCGAPCRVLYSPLVSVGLWPQVDQSFRGRAVL